MKTASSRGYFSSLWGIVLAAGDGKRVGPMVHSLRGDTLPKQFVNFGGAPSMLQRTFERAEKLISRERLLVVVNREHMKYPEVRDQLSGRVKDTVIVQPENKDTVPGLLLPLLHIYRRDPLATVVVLPSDHFVAEEDRFVKYVFLACRTVEREPSRLVLLGVEPDRPEGEYGYIVPGEEPNAMRGFGPRRVSSFIEKPSPEELRALIENGALWNMMVLVFKVFTVFDLTARLAPELHARFERLGGAIGTRAERRAVTDAYREIEPLNFSTGLLERLPKASPNSLLTIPLEGVLWNDLGSPERLASVLTMSDTLGQAENTAATQTSANRKKISRPTSRTKSDRITLQMR